MSIYHTTQLYNRDLVRKIHTLQVAEYTTIKIINVISGIIGGPGKEALIMTAMLEIITEI